MQDNTNYLTPREHEVTIIKSPVGTSISIDSGIVNLIELLWELGIETLYSCEGSPSPFRGGAIDKAYISMRNTITSQNFIVKLIKSKVYQNITQESLWIIEFDKHATQGNRICIRLPHMDIDIFSDFVRSCSRDLHGL